MFVGAGTASFFMLYPGLIRMMRCHRTKIEVLLVVLSYITTGIAGECTVIS
jgi:hypothetical protein